MDDTQMDTQGGEFPKVLVPKVSSKSFILRPVLKKAMYISNEEVKQLFMSTYASANYFSLSVISLFTIQ